MARRTSQEVPQTLVNSDARKERISYAITQWSQIDAGLKAIEEQKAPLKAELKKLKKVVVEAELGFKLVDFAILRRLYELEPDDRQQTIDTLREGYAALQVGEQMDFLDAVGARKSAAQENVEPSVEQAKTLGYDAAKNDGKKLTDCPYTLPRQKAIRAAWENGWSTAQEALANEMRPVN